MAVSLPSQRIQWFIIITTFLGVHVGCYLIYHGRPLDDAEHYLKAGALLLKEGRIDDHFHPLYLVPILLIAGFTSWFNDPGTAYVIFQIVISVCAVYVLYRTMESIATQKAAFLAAMIFALWIDNVRWNVLIMTESLFGSVVIFVLNRISALNREHQWSVITLLVLLIVVVFIRPVGILVVFAASAAIIHKYVLLFGHSKRTVVTGSLLATAGVVVVSLYLSGTWDFTDQYYRGNVVTYADTYPGDRSWIQFDPYYADISDDPPVLRAIRFFWKRPLHVISVSVLKLFYLLSGVRPYYSVSHNTITLVWMTFVYFGAFLGIRTMTRSPFKTALITLMAGNCLLVVMTTVDWDNRFYIPMEAAVIVFSAYGWSGAPASPVWRIFSGNADRQIGKPL